VQPSFPHPQPPFPPPLERFADSVNQASAELELLPPDNDRLARLCGQFNAHLKQIESHLGVHITQHGHHFSIHGERRRAADASRLLQRLYRDAGRGDGGAIAPQRIHMMLTDMAGGESADVGVTIRTRKGRIGGQTPRQRAYLARIQGNDINFGIGPAGTGKTYLAVASAARALVGGECERILLVRPVVEAGERLGFLPGDIGQKVDPYLRPLYDALYEMLGFDKVARLLERGVIELAPLAYMRGRTLNNSFVILDEAQNTTVEQMKMFLTRTGFGSRVVVTGDVTQIDLPAGVRSGLRHAARVLDGIEGISFTRFTAADVVRHPLVRKIVQAYDGDAAGEQS